MAKKNDNEYSDMMIQYINKKKEYEDCILFYRLGDFYEMFFEDAVTCSKELELVLTSKNCGNDKKAPMCGVPFHSAENYVRRLVNRGYKVAICEQLTKPVPGKVVQRDVVRVISPGTLIDDSMLESSSNNYIACIIKEDNKYAISYCDISTGDFYAEKDTDNINKIEDIIIKVRPAEIIGNKNINEKDFSLAVQSIIPAINKYEDYYFDDFEVDKILKKQFCDNYKNLYSLNNDKLCIKACGGLIINLEETQKRELYQLNKIKFNEDNENLILDINTRRNLEITETMRDRKKRGTLLWVLDQTTTSMGARCIKNWVSNPLKNEKEINLRLNAIEELNSNFILRDKIINELKEIQDIERIASKIAYNNASPKDYISLKYSLKVLPNIQKLLSTTKSSKLNLTIPDLSEVYNIIDKSIIDEREDNSVRTPQIIREGNFIKKGYNEELDRIKNISSCSKKLVLELENREKEKTGILKLKTGYNSVFGYYIEIPKSQIELVPYNYVRKQTTANTERYITEELKNLEYDIANASTMSLQIELDLYSKLREFMLNYLERMQSVSKMIAELDCLISLSLVATRNNYVKPKINSKINSINIIEGRHPVIEKILSGSQFISNDTYLDNDNRAMIITGPNMSGKSTYMRQVALITLMAHIGSFVPCKSAEICLTDRIFTRVGASDDLAFGQSTFMVEMSEVSNILLNATDKSLVILDEVGRGTSTFDGLSIAWAVIEYICKNIKCKTLFATHYHELTELEGQLEGVKNYKINVKEYNGSVIFLHKIVRGGALKSFGIEVAKLAGVPEKVIERAKDISNLLENKDLNFNLRNSEEEVLNKNIINKNNEVVSILKDIKIERISPMEAFEILNDLIKRI